MSDLTCGSLFSGVGGMDIGLSWAGFRHTFFAEIDEYGRAVLAARFPGVHIYEDVRDVGADAGSVSVLAGGFPCQDLSVAGKRAGLEGEQSGLFHEFMRIADDVRPRAILVENVEGLYSSNGGRDFGVVLDALAERGMVVAWRTLDAQHFGVPQRRRRVFVCAIADGDSGAERIGEVFAFSEGGERHPSQGDPTWPLTAPGVGSGAAFGGRTVGALSAQGYTKYTDQEFVRGGQLVTGSDLPPVSALQGGGKRGYRVDAEGAAGGHLIPFRKSARTRGGDTPETWVDDGRANTLNTFDVGDVRTTHAVVGFSHTQGLDPQAQENVTPTLRKNGGGMAAQHGATVRRLTPLECERLMGWPDGWTDIPWRGKEHAPDSRRYAACGNGVVAPVSYWIGARLAEVLK